ncbi:MAG: pentapeptide repeat-containing protein [Bacteroidota bacterium]
MVGHKKYILVSLILLLNWVDGFGQKRKGIDSLVYKGIEFDSVINYNLYQVHGLVDFSKTKFHSKAKFNGTQFDSKAYFREAQFDSLTYFGGAQFDSVAYFTKTQFHSEAYLHYTQFGSKVSFTHTQFHSEAYFRGAQFHSEAYFQEAQFGFLADFTKAQFHSEVLFDGLQLPDILCFNKIKTDEIIDFTGTRIDLLLKRGGKHCFIDLRGAPIEKFNLRYSQFRVYHPPNIDRVEFESITNVYEGLLKNFKDRGYISSYEKLDKEYREFKYTKDPDRSILDLLLNFINKHWSDYGYDKGRIWRHTAIAFLFFLLINWIRLPHLTLNIYSIAIVDKVLRKKKKLRAYRLVKGNYPLFNIYAPSLAFFYTALIFFGLKMSTENLKLENPFGVAYIFFQYVIGLVCLAYLANYIISSNLIGS